MKKVFFSSLTYLLCVLNDWRFPLRVTFLLFTLNYFSTKRFLCSRFFFHEFWVNVITVKILNNNLIQRIRVNSTLYDFLFLSIEFTSKRLDCFVILTSLDKYLLTFKIFKYFASQNIYVIKNPCCRKFYIDLMRINVIHTCMISQRIEFVWNVLCLQWINNADIAVVTQICDVEIPYIF